MTFFSNVIRGFSDLVAPPTCGACDLDLRTPEAGFCAGCATLIEPAHRTLQPPAPSAALFVYGGPLATALQRFKYNRRTELANPLSALLCTAVVAYAGRVDVVVPMPLHRKNLSERGYNQVALLSRPLARRLGVPMTVTQLKRVRPTDRQANLPREQRYQNVRGAFRAQPPTDGRRALLVDDVRTSGATLAEAAEALREAGATEVFTLALAFAQS